MSKSDEFEVKEEIREENSTFSAPSQDGIDEEKVLHATKIEPSVPSPTIPLTDLEAGLIGWDSIDDIQNPLLVSRSPNEEHKLKTLGNMAYQKAWSMALKQRRSDGALCL